MDTREGAGGTDSGITVDHRDNLESALESSGSTSFFLLRTRDCLGSSAEGVPGTRNFNFYATRFVDLGIHLVIARDLFNLHTLDFLLDFEFQKFGSILITKYSFK